MNPVGKVMCKLLSNRMLHTYKGMIGYCLKNIGLVHFDCAMYNVSNVKVMIGKTLHSFYGKVDLKGRVILTNKNVVERMYVWNKYKVDRPFVASFLSTLTYMIKSGIFMPSTAWIIPFNGQGMEYWRMTGRSLEEHY